MTPGRYDVRIYKGDSYHGPLITLPSLEPFGGPVDLTGATGAAQIRASEEATDVLAQFAVIIENATLRQLRLTLTPAQTTALTIEEAVWDLQIATPGGWVGTPLAGRVKVMGEVTR